MSQSTKDALADAETLRLMAAVPIDYDPDYLSWCASPTWRAINNAVQSAYMAIGGARCFAYERASEAAHYAFLAVPGLR